MSPCMSKKVYVMRWILTTGSISWIGAPCCKAALLPAIERFLLKKGEWDPNKWSPSIFQICGGGVHQIIAYGCYSWDILFLHVVCIEETLVCKQRCGIGILYTGYWYVVSWILQNWCYPLGRTLCIWYFLCLLHTCNGNTIFPFGILFLV